ncbi:MAG: UbiD family decarboxylase [Bacillota bacterium]
MASIKDLRDFLDELEKRGELCRVTDEVHWKLEMSAIGAMSNRLDDKIPLFEKIKGYPDGQRAVTDPYRGSHGAIHRRIAISLGMDSNMSYEEYTEEFIERLNHPIRPIVVDKGECQEVVHLGEDANVFKYIPVPFIHEGDGGRYFDILTIIAKDPDSDWNNWCNYRCMVHSKNKMGILFTAGQQTANLYYFKYEARNQPMPVAIALGGLPATSHVAGMPLPAGVSEVDYAGGLMKEPVQLVKCITNDLLVPASAEFIIEGVMLPGERVDEGPFGEFLGYIHGPRRPAPVVRVQAITHRKNPILPFCIAGAGHGDSTTYLSSEFNALLTPTVLNVVRSLGFPVKAIVGPETNSYASVIIATKVPYQGYVKELAELILAVPGPSMYVDQIFVVDEDVDISNMEAVWEEVMLKSHPIRDWHNYRDPEGPRSPLNIYQKAEEKGTLRMAATVAKTSKCYIDATTKQWDEVEMGPRRMEFETLYPTYKHWVEKNRSRFGIPPYEDFRHEGIPWMAKKA